MWTKAAKAADIEEGKAVVVSLGGKDVAIFKAQGNFYALDSVCPHRGGPLGEGYLDGLELTCPWHAWTFDLKTGNCSTAADVRQKTFPVKLEHDEVWVDT